jgi:hypothetical protein
MGDSQMGLGCQRCSSHFRWTGNDSEPSGLLRLINQHNSSWRRHDTCSAKTFSQSAALRSCRCAARPAACRITNRISPENAERMRDPDALGQMKPWIMEVQLVDRAPTFERLLRPAELMVG